MKKTSSLLLPLAALAACATTPAPSLNQWVKLGEATRVGPVVVQPISVTEDSRCPMNARCVWAGRVTILARLTADGATSEVTIHSNEPLTLSDGSLVIDAIEPDSFMTNAHPQPGDYRFHFAFED